MKKKIIAFVLFLEVVSTSFVEYQIEGRVLNSLTDKPIEYFSIGVFSTADSKIVNVKITDEKSTFNIKYLKAGVYHLKIDFIGLKFNANKTLNSPLFSDKVVY